MPEFNFPEKNSNKFDLSTTDGEMSLSAKGKTYSVQLDNMDLLGEKYNVISVMTTEAEDAVLVDSTAMSFKQVVETIVRSNFHLDNED